MQEKRVLDFTRDEDDEIEEINLGGDEKDKHLFNEDDGKKPKSEIENDPEENENQPNEEKEDENE